MAILLAATLTSACGGSATTETATVPATSAPTTPSTTNSKPTPRQELRAYLAAMVRVHRRTNPATLQKRTGTALRNVDGYADSTWDTAGAATLDEARHIDKEAVGFLAITPPEGLKRAQSRYIDALTASGAAGRQLGLDLKAHADASTVSGDFTSYDNAGVVGESAWRLAVRSRCRVLHIPFPAWVGQIGNETKIVGPSTLALVFTAVGRPRRSRDGLCD